MPQEAAGIVTVCQEHLENFHSDFYCRHAQTVRASGTDGLQVTQANSHFLAFSLPHDYSTPPSPIPFNSILILSSHLRQVLSIL